MTFKRKKRQKNSRNKYLKPGALAQICYSRTSSKSRTDTSKKRIVLESGITNVNMPNQADVIQNTPVVSPIRVSLQSALDELKVQNLPLTPLTPRSPYWDNQSRLESLPMDILVKILCHLRHDQLQAAFHVSQRIRTALTDESDSDAKVHTPVLLARQLHFNYTTPDRSRLEIHRTKTPIPAEHWPFLSKVGQRGTWGSSPRTPKAPRHGPRPSRFQLMDLKQIAAVLFQETTLPSRQMMPQGSPRTVFKPGVSSRVLFYEDELCQAVAQNKLR